MQERQWNDPFSFLGMHAEKGGIVVRASLPHAGRAFTIDRRTGALYAMEREKDGLYAARFPRERKPFPYALAA